MDPHLERPADWYKPGPVEPERAAHGTYRVGENGDPEVRLFGTWDRSRPSIAHDPEEPFPSIVRGHVWEEVVTLVGCRLKTRKRGLSPQQDTTVTCDYAIEGAAFEPDDLFLTEVHVKLWDQDTWTDADSFKDEHEVVSGPEGDRETWAVHYLRQPTREARFPGGRVRLTDASKRHTTSNPRGWVLATETRFEIRFDKPVLIDDVFGSYIVPLEFLLVLATGRPSGVRSMVGTNRAWKVEGEPDGAPPWVTFRVGYEPRSQRDRWVAHLLHRLEDFDFKRQFGSVFKVVRKHRYSIEHYVALRGDRGSGHLARFVAATQLVESYHRTLDATTSKDEFHRRLRELDAQVGGLVTDLVGTDQWVIHIRDLRNMVVHGFENADSLTDDVRPLQASVSMLLLLFEARFLVSLGFDATDARRMVERRVDHRRTARFIQEQYPHLVAFATSKGARSKRSSN